MIFDDSLEYDGFFPANGAELIAMKKWHDIKLADIWIPSELLPNRDLPLRLNLNKSVLYHTLEKPKPPEDSLSVYSDRGVAAIENHYRSEELLDSLEDFAFEKRWEEYEAATLSEEDCPSSIIKESNSDDQEIFKSGENSFADLLEHLCLSDSDGEDQAVATKPVFDPVSKDNVMHLEFHSSQEFHNNVDEKASSDKSINKNYESTKQSDVLCSDSTEIYVSNKLALNQEEFSNVPVSDSEIIDVNCKLNEFVKSDIENIAEDKSTLEKVSKDINNPSAVLQESEASLDVAYISNKSHPLTPNIDNVSKTDSMSKVSLPKPMFLHKNSSNDDLRELAHKEDVSFNCNPTEADKLVFATEDEVSFTQAEPKNLFPILYTVSKKEEVVTDTACTNRRKVKKDKKPKKNASKNIDLCSFFLTENEFKDKKSKEIPDYANYLMQKQYGSDSPERSIDNFSESNMVFPSLTEKPDPDYEGLFGKIEEAEDVKLSLKSVTNLLKEASHPPVADKTDNVDTPDSRIKIKIHIENIPLGVDKDSVESILHNYGSINRMTLRRHGVFLKADVQLYLHPHIEDPEWIIECLNGSQPFGVSASGEELKCYLRK